MKILGLTIILLPSYTFGGGVGGGGGRGLSGMNNISGLNNIPISGLTPSALTITGIPAATPAAIIMSVVSKGQITLPPSQIVFTTSTTDTTDKSKDKDKAPSPSKECIDEKKDTALKCAVAIIAARPCVTTPNPVTCFTAAVTGYICIQGIRKNGVCPAPMSK